jgi:predicted Mrr-cat superfamily restriction endonuclease
MAYHEPEHAKNVAQWSRREGVIAIGWGLTGDLRQQQFRDKKELTRLVIQSHPMLSIRRCANSGPSLWNLYREMHIGDLVILNTNGRSLTMRITGNYYFIAGEHPPYYEHRRKAEAVPIDPNRLWQVSGGGAQGEGIYSSLIRCANTLNEAEFEALIAG